jgi:hypothetical protein
MGLALLLPARDTKADYTTGLPKVPSQSYHATNSVAYNTQQGPYHIGSFFDVFTELSIQPPPAPGTSRTDSFFDVFTELALTPPVGPPITATPGSAETIHITAHSPGSPQLYDTEMLQMDLSGGGLPAGVMIRESPTLASTGGSSITDLGGGQFHISSFFDIFTELTIDGGQTWVPADGPLHVDGTPEPGALVLCSLGVAFVAMRRRRAGQGTR